MLHLSQKCSPPKEQHPLVETPWKPVNLKKFKELIGRKINISINGGDTMEGKFENKYNSKTNFNFLSLEEGDVWVLPNIIPQGYTTHHIINGINTNFIGTLYENEKKEFLVTTVAGTLNRSVGYRAIGGHDLAVSLKKYVEN